MSEKYLINRDIYGVITSPSMNEFQAAQVRELIQKASNAYDDSNNTRVLVARHLNKLERIGALTSTGVRQSKKYKKTASFDEFNFVLKDKRSRSTTSNVNEPSVSKLKSELIKEKTDIETELRIALAEVEEYRGLMNRSSELTQILNEPYALAATKTASLVAKLNVWSKAIKLVSEKEIKVC
ncbi:hypothetical protein GT360_01445 [Vibrio astriarenae]|uniref:Transcriptional regulator VspR n=1 Tax=Vibrio astriarenae TaxID=1481923 RepID=A0A7Z2T104_9VIBR|nr:hypothetical protein [Vibrio astriarenae]QIA62275.1 hypothetical protein GT360_01445 [Vibrio astriarenae]